MTANEDVWISDLTCCAPSEAISGDGKPGTWIAVDYEVDEGAGVMLYGTGALNPPPITLPLKSSGLHAIYLGIHYGSKNGFVADRRLQVKLPRDAAFSRMRKEHLPGSKKSAGTIYQRPSGRWQTYPETTSSLRDHQREPPPNRRGTWPTCGWCRSMKLPLPSGKRGSRARIPSD